MKNLILILSITFLSLTSCSKDDAPAPVIPLAVPVVQSCFPETLNGNYLGQDGTQPHAGSITVKFTKIGCDTCKLESTVLGNKNVVSIAASAPTAYVGKLSDGSSVQIVLTGSDISIQCTGYAFAGTRQ